MLKNILVFVILFSAVYTLDNGLGLTPPMGWNSWNHFGCNINEELIKQTAKTLISSGLAAKGYIYVNLDDCWQISRSADGKIQSDPIAFPSGMKALADYVHSLGLKFGLYSDAGSKTCAGRPGSLGFEEHDAKTYAEWGVDYLKYDNCFDDGSSPKVRYPVMSKSLANTGRKIFFSMCEWGVEEPSVWAGVLANSWRTTGDIEDKWESFLDILDKQHGLEKYAMPGAWNDPDMLEVGNGGMAHHQYEAHFALWALLKSPLLIGTDITKMTDSTRKILFNEDVIAISQDPLGKQGKRISRVEKPTGHLDVYSGELQDGVAIILFNRSLNKEKITVQFKDTEFKHKGGPLSNLITKEKYGYIENSFSADVEPHSVIVLKLKNPCDKFINCLN